MCSSLYKCRRDNKKKKNIILKLFQYYGVALSVAYTVWMGDRALGLANPSLGCCNAFQGLADLLKAFTFHYKTVPIFHDQRVTVCADVL